MTHKLKIGWVLLSFLFLTSCQKENSNDVNQSRIYASYELFYNANEDITYARASFRFGNITGTPLELTNPSEVRFNDQVLSFNSGLVYYEKTFAGFVQSGTFTWKDTEDNTFNNTIEMHTIDYPVSLDTIYRDAAFEFLWQGDSLGANEMVTLSIKNILEDDPQLFYQSNVNGKSIMLAMSKLQLLAEGQGQLWMERKYSPSLVEKTSAGGTISSRYRPINKLVYLK